MEPEGTPKPPRLRPLEDAIALQASTLARVGLDDVMRQLRDSIALQAPRLPIPSLQLSPSLTSSIQETIRGFHLANELRFGSAFADLSRMADSYRLAASWTDILGPLRQQLRAQSALLPDISSLLPVHGLVPDHLLQDLKTLTLAAASFEGLHPPPGLRPALERALTDGIREVESTHDLIEKLALAVAVAIRAETKGRVDWKYWAALVIAVVGILLTAYQATGSEARVLEAAREGRAETAALRESVEALIKSTGREAILTHGVCALLHPRSGAPVVAWLSEGDTVFALTRRVHWTLVVWQEGEHSLLRTGWLRNKYLQYQR